MEREEAMTNPSAESIKEAKKIILSVIQERKTPLRLFPKRSTSNKQEIESLNSKLQIARRALSHCIANAGHPDPLFALRAVIKTADEALEKIGEAGGK
ncbi:MAG TPA: hypothetical protein VJL87_02330 [Bdellovibrionota bacterium]|nr:hypothetical protein [Bdellovibrionota bacterium]